jgi:hypothetical protein
MSSSEKPEGTARKAWGMKGTSALTLCITQSFDPEDLASRWQELEAVAEPSFFLSWLWIGTWLRHIPRNVRPTLFEWRQDGELAALGIVYGHDRHVLHRFANRAAVLHDTGRRETNFVIEYNGVLTRKGFENAVAESWLDYFLRQQEWDEWVLNGIRCSDSLLSHPRVRATLLLDRVNMMPALYVDLQRLRDERKSVFEVLSRNTRYQLRKALRELEERGELVTERAQTLVEALRYFDGLKELHQLYWQGKGKAGSFANPRWEAFHRDLIKDGFDLGRIQLLRFLVGEEVLGYLYNLIYQGRVSMVQSGFNYERFADQKPGYVCNYLAMEYNLEQGMTCYDFLAGDERYKRSLANEAEDLCWVALRKKTLQNRVESLLLKVYRMRKTQRV